MIINEITYNLLKNIEKDDFIGWDIFDGLNSRLFQNTPFYNFKLFRLIWIQFFKRSPINFRKITHVTKGYNSKGLALFIQGLIKLYKIENKKKYLDQAQELANIIISQRASDRDYFCVGYNFFWEARAFSVPKFTPNMIVSTFVGQSFLDLYDITNNSHWLDLVKQICVFIQEELTLINKEDKVCFGYIPGESAIVHNANLMGARLLARMYSITKNDNYKKLAYSSANFTINHQNKDGSWVYGNRDHHQWIDNFHTGFILVSLKDIQKYLSTKLWSQEIESGFLYHQENHFLHDMTPKFYNNKKYPLDIHNFAQGIITFLNIGHKKKAEQILSLAIDLMWDKNEKYFYYQRTRFYKNKINYIRWSQAWMFRALTDYYYEDMNENTQN